MQADGEWRRWSRQGLSDHILGGREVDQASRGGRGSTLSLEAEGGEGQEVDSEGQVVGEEVMEGEEIGEVMEDMDEALDVVVVAATEEVKEDMGVVVVDMDVEVAILVAVLVGEEDEGEPGLSSCSEDQRN